MVGFMPRTAAAVLLFAVAALAQDAPTAPPPRTIPDILTGTGYHTTLVAALAKADLVDALSGDGPFTVFAPTDDAFAAAGIKLGNIKSAAQVAALRDTLQHHVFGGEVLAEDIVDGEVITMLDGVNATLHTEAMTVFIDDAAVTDADLLASNGVVHVIDAVLSPETPEKDGDATDLTALWVCIVLFGTPTLLGLAFYLHRKRQEGRISYTRV